MKLANAVVEAVNADDVASFSKLYTSDAVVVDEIPPFLWRGADAGVAWWRAVEAFTTKKHEHLKFAGVGISEFQRSAADAYLIQSMTLLELGSGPPRSEYGTMTYTFHSGDGAWRISSQVWTTKP